MTSFLPLQEFWREYVEKNETLRSAWKSFVDFTLAVVVATQEGLHSLIVYLQANGPVWLEMIRDNTMSAVTSIKNSVQSMLK